MAVKFKKKFQNENLKWNMYDNLFYSFRNATVINTLLDSHS